MNPCIKITMVKWIVLNLLFISSLLAQVPGTAPGYYNIMEFGAKGDGKSNDTRSVQLAINSCFQKGGGTVYFPPGIFLCGSLHLKSNVALYLDHGATLLASTDENDFDPYEVIDFDNDSDKETTYFHYALIWGEDVERIAILGTGMIDGNRTKRGGPKSIALKRCKYVTIKDVTILNAPNYAISMLGTDYVNIDGVNILNGYCDGIDPDCCHHVKISNCQIETWDDAIVPKASFSLGERRSTEYLTITNCILATNCNAFKLGTESRGDFKYITLSNCVMYRRIGRPPTSGIALESVDGAHIDGITISNISMNNVKSPIFLRLGNRGRDQDTPVPGSLKNVIITNITATNASSCCPISGIPGYNVENVTLDNIRLTYDGGGTLAQTQIDVPENIDKYPEASMFGDLPAYGFYCRHINGIKFRNVQLAFKEPDLRHAMVCEDVTGMAIESLTAQQAEKGESILKFNQVRDTMISGCMPFAGTDTFLKVLDQASCNITLTGNDFSRVHQVNKLEKGAKKDCIFLSANR